MHLPPIGSSEIKPQKTSSNQGNPLLRSQLHSASSLASSKSTSCLGSIISAIQSLFRAIYQLITCGLLKTTESSQEKEEESEPSLTSSENSSEVDEPPTPDLPTSIEPTITSKEAATQFLDDFFNDPVKTFNSQSDRAFTGWNSENPTPEFLKDAFVFFLCVNEAPSGEPCKLQYKGHTFSIEHWMIAYYIDKYQPDLTKPVAEMAMSPLHAASSKETAALLAQKCPDLVEKPSKEGATPLLIASERNLDEVVECLIGLNANCLATVPTTGDTALHLTKSLKVVRLLLAKEPSLLNTKNSNSQIPLHRALNNEELAAFYIAQGANLRACDDEGAIPLSSCWDPKIAQLMLNRDQTLVNHRNDKGNTPLCYARNPRMALFFLEKGAEIESTNKEGATPLSVLLGKDSIATAEVLIDRGANLEINVRGEPLLHFLIDKSRNADWYALLKKSLAKTKDIDVKDKSGRTLLQHQIDNNWYDRKEHYEIIQLLIERGANLSIEIKGEPLLHFLIDKTYDKEWVPIFRAVLAKRSQNIDIPDSKGRTLLQHVIERNWNSNEESFAIIDLLIEQGANLVIAIHDEPLLHYLLDRSQFHDTWREIFIKVFEKRAQNREVENRDEQGKSILQHALEKCRRQDLDSHFKIALFLIGKKADTGFIIDRKPLHEWVKERPNTANWRAISGALTPASAP